MKVRQGFVSNSSTTSFVIVGACIDSEDFEEMVNMDKILTQDFRS